MASKKTNETTKSKPKSPSQSAKKPTDKSSSRPKTSKTSSAKSKQRKEAELNLKRNKFIKSIVLFAVTALLTAFYIMPGEKLWLALHQCYWGFFGFMGFAVPLITLYCAVQLAKTKPSYRFSLRAILFVLLLLVFASIIYSFSSFGIRIDSYGDELSRCFTSGVDYQGTGISGGLLGIAFVKILGSAGAGIVFIIAFIIIATISLDAFIINLFDIFKKPVHKVSERINENKEIRKVIRQQENQIKQERQQREHEEYVQQKINKHINKVKSKNGVSSDFCRVDSTPFYEPQTSRNSHQSNKQKSSVNTDKNKKSKSRTTSGDKALDIIFGYDTEDTTVEPSTNQDIVNQKGKNGKTLQEEKTPQNVDTFEYIPEEPPIFADDIQFDTSFINNVSETNNNTPVKKNIDKTSVPKVEQNNIESKNKNTQPKVDTFTVNNDNPLVDGEYIKPPVTLLEPQPEEDGRNISLELHQNGTMLVDTLKSFGVQTTIVNISRGPSVTRYELQPAAGIKISKITNLADDIAMNLAATGVRIEAPIPGKSAVGIEVPNKNVNIVRMRNIIESPEFTKAKSKLTVALGYDITGKITLADLAKMPHLLIAGSTGSGKSVCINSMLVSLLYKANPDEVKLMLIDPKVVELGVYNGIPHLLVPVVTDPRKAAGALNWAVNEMLERYKTFAEHNVRDMQSYNRLVDRKNSEINENDTGIIDDSERSFEEDEMLAQAQSEVANSGEITERTQKLEKMPQIVIVIDELADLMMATPNEVEESICRLAQMARAAGMHLVIATQRPSVDVITGLIKANVPSRIAFAVKSQIDSRTILDGGGAEKLLGRGDMLFSPIGTTKPIRVQGCYVDDVEVENIVEFIKKSKVVEYDNNVIEEIEKNAIAENVKGNSDSGEESADPMMEQAIKCVVEAGQASTSLLQRRLRLGYARAGRLIDEMEQMGIVGPHEGSKPRQVLMTHQQWLERNMMRSDDNN